MTSPSILVIGLDGATWDLIRPWAEDGSLPFFQKLLRDGASGPLRSVTPNLTPPGWTTAFTGVNPGRHGLFDFFTLDPGNTRQRLTTSKDRVAPALWEILGAEGLGCGVFNVPCSYPADPVNGFFVTGMGTPGFDGDWAWPGELRERLRSDHPGFRFGVDHSFFERRDYEGFLDALYTLTDLQEKAFLGLLGEHRPRAAIFVYDDLDRILHFFWKFMDPDHPRFEHAPDRIAEGILRYHRRIEEGIVRLREAMGADTHLCILSDHGFGPLHTDVYLNVFLADWGYLQPVPAAREILRKPLWKRAAKRLVPGAVRSWLRTRVKASPLADPLGYIDFTRTRAFYASVSGRSVYVNVKGRQPCGIVDPGAEYERVRDELVERLRDIRDPETGERVVADVHKREAVYSGPCLEAAPDLLIQENGLYAYRVDWRESPFSPASQYGVEKTGSHRPLGILALDGPMVKPASIEGARLEDVTPTLLALLGLPAGEQMEGRVLEEAFRNPPDPSKRDYSALRGGAGRGLGADEEAQLAERLKGLGYM